MTDLDTRTPEFAVVLRGYDRLQVDAYITRLEGLLDEATDRARVAERKVLAGERAEVGPRVAQIFDLASAEAEDIRSDAQREAERVRQAAESDAKAVAAQNQADWENLLDKYEDERERIRLDVEELNRRKGAVLQELRRLQEAIGAASGLVTAASPDEQLELDSHSEDETRLLNAASVEPADDSTDEFIGEADTRVFDSREFDDVEFIDGESNEDEGRADAS